MMQIKILEESLKLNIDGKLQPFVKDDIKTVEDEIGQTCVKFGWAEDVSGSVPTGERKPGANGPIVPDNVKVEIT